MKLSAKGRYAIKALVNIATNESSTPKTLLEISKYQGISLSYLEQLFSLLRKHDLVSGVRGPGGGYKIARNTELIRISEILSAVDETMDAMSRGAGASGGDIGSHEEDLAEKLWEQLSAHIYVFLHQTRLSDLIEKQIVPCPAVPAFVEMVDV